MLIRALTIATVLVVGATTHASASARAITAPSRIDAVTVYPHAARVTRVATIDVPAGDVRVALEGLTDQLLDDSLRVSGTGSARVTVFGAVVERVPHVETTSEEVRAADATLTALKDQDRALDDQLKSGSSRRELLDSLRSTYVRERTENLAVRPMDPNEWSGLVDFVARQYDAVLEQVRKTEIARRDLAKRIAAAQQALDQIRRRGSLVTKDLIVDLHAQAAGSFEMRVSYVVPSASWKPIWDARLDVESETVALSLHGSVQQFSGEAWTDVALALSTAQPSRAISVPDVSPQYLEPMRPITSFPAAPSGFVRESAEVAKVDRFEVAEEAPAAITQGLLAATFEAPRRESIDSAGTPRRAFLATFPLKAALSRLAAPKLDTQAVLVARATHASGPVLLPGSVNIFLGDELTGTTSLPLTAPGDDVTLAFGPDDRVKIERAIIERKHETTGLFAKEELYRYRIRTTVKNLYETAVTVTVIEQVPVSRDETITVAILDKSTTPTDPEIPDKPGVRRFTYTLQPAEERVIQVGYEVRFPRGLTISGLE